MKKNIKTFAVESIFEGKEYIGIFDHRTGELIRHEYGGQPEQTEAEQPQETKPKDKNQLQLF